VKTLKQRIGLIAATGVVILLTGCSTPANREAMTPQNVAISKHHPFSIQVQTAGGTESDAMQGSSISDADLKAAIEDAITQSKVFKNVIQGANGDYNLSVRVTSLSKPMFGATFTVDIETAWVLTKTSDKSVVLKKAIKSSGTATMGDAFVGVTRLRLAVENAAKENISEGIKALAGLNL
jgi:hypothetical protein